MDSVFQLTELIARLFFATARTLLGWFYHWFSRGVADLNRLGHSPNHT